MSALLVAAVYLVIFLLQYGDSSSSHPLALFSSRATSLPSNCSSDDTCPAGLFCSEGQCECKPLLNDLVTCGEDGNGVSLTVRLGYCVTSDGADEGLTVGACSVPMTNFTCFSSELGLYSYYYSILPGQLNNACTRIGRTGKLCGRCLPGHSPLAYSYNMTCVPCPHPHWNWLWYIMAAYLPLTLFYFFILFFNVKTTSAHLHVAICVCQVISAPPIIRHLYNVCAIGENNAGGTFLSAIFTLYGIWNLDFFRLFYSNLCLGIGVLPMLALDYAIAVYPLLLMVVSYLLITLYDKNYRVVTLIWSPFLRLFFLFRKNWNVKTSLIDSFATFFFLSNIKFLLVSFNLLFPTNIHHFDGNNYTSSLGLLYAPDVEYFGKEHLPFVILAISVLFFVLCLPITLLALYPFRFFQRFLNLFPFRWYILHTFMDSFLGCYKDGTQPGTRDCRSFLAYIYLIRLGVIVIIGSTEILQVTLATIALFLQCSMAIFLVVKPCKTPPHYSNLTVTLYVLLLQFIAVTFATVGTACYFGSKWCVVFNALLALACCIPLLDALRVAITYMLKRRRGISRLLAHCWRRHRNRLDGYTVLPGEDVAGDERDREVMADRIEDYLAVNSVTSFQTDNEPY